MITVQYTSYIYGHLATFVLCDVCECCAKETHLFQVAVVFQVVVNDCTHDIDVA